MYLRENYGHDQSSNHKEVTICECGQNTICHSCCTRSQKSLENITWETIGTDEKGNEYFITWKVKV